MKSVLKLVVILLVVGGLHSCDTDCPAFPEHLMDYLPYRKGDMLKFTNENNEMMSMKVDSVRTTGEHSYGFGCECACVAEHFFVTDNDILSELGIKGRISLVEGNWEHADIRLGIDIDRGHFNISNDSFPEKISIFSDTLILENYSNEIKKLIIVKGEGIVEFDDIERNCIWKKVKE